MVRKQLSDYWNSFSFVGLTVATSIPPGYGHNYSPVNYIDAWLSLKS